MKKVLKKTLILVAVLLIVLSQSVICYADNDLWFNTLNDQAFLTNIDTLNQYDYGYFIGVNDKDDWELTLAQDESTENSIFAKMYSAKAKVGDTITASLSCMTEDAVVAIMINEGDEESPFTETGDTNWTDGQFDGRDSVDYDFVVPDGTDAVLVTMLGFSAQSGYGKAGSFVLMVEFEIDGEAVGVIDPVDQPEDGGSDEAVNPADDGADPDEGLPATGRGKKLPVGAAAGGVAAVGVGIAIAKGAKGKGPKGGKPAAGEQPTPTPTPAEPVTPQEPETYVHKDVATGAETLYVKDEDSGAWVSQDGTTVLDMDNVPEWDKQRAADRAWQDAANEGVKNPTRFADIDAEEQKQIAEIERDTYLEKVAIKHGMDTSDMDAVFDKVSADQARDEVFAQQWTEIADHADTGLKIAENLKKTADVSISALGAVTGPAGTIVKDIYTAGTTIGGDVSQAVNDGKDIYETAQVAAAAVTKTAVGVIQNHAAGVGQKVVADVAGGATTGGIDAYVKGEDVGQGIATGTASGLASATVDTFGEMAGALKDANIDSKDIKDAVSAVSDVIGDQVKDATGNAISDSFEKTFNELNPKKE